MKFCLTGILCFISLLSFAQTQPVDFKTLQAELSIFPKEEKVEGHITVSFQPQVATDSVFLDAKNVSAQLKQSTSSAINLSVTNQKIWFIGDFKAHKTYTVSFTYSVTHPKKSLYFVGWNNGSDYPQVWSQGQGHYTSYWLPSLDDKTDKITFDLTYKVPQGFTAISNGELISSKSKGNHMVWHYKMQHPMSSYLVALTVGNFKKDIRFSSQGTPIELYYLPKDSTKVEPTYRYSTRIFDFLEQEIGVAYPWKNYKQIPVRDFLYAGMENTTATIFAENLMTDSIGFIDRNYISVNAHELAHQWFGDYITETDSRSHWLQEGFATYYALLAEREIFGDDYFYFKLFESAQQLKARSDKGQGEALTNPKANSLTFYQKGAWALVVLRQKLGDAIFKKGIQSYLNAYAYQNVSTADFIAVMEDVSQKDLTEFVNNWLNQSAFQAQQALGLLKTSPFIKKFMTLKALQTYPLSDKNELFSDYLSFPVNVYLGQEVVHQLATAPVSSTRLVLYKKAFNSNNTLVRQAIAESLQEIPLALKTEFEQLLNDPSYLTQELALMTLWKNFPNERSKYLNQLQHTQGFYNKNMRLLWLTLSLVTPDYHSAQKSDYYRELSQYTLPKYDYTIRQNAFAHLYQIASFTPQNYKDLLEACTHPVWQFRSFAKQLLAALVKDAQQKTALEALLPTLNSKQQQILQSALQPKK